MDANELKRQILGVVGDLVADLLWYSRKDDQDLPRGTIEAAVQQGIVTPDEMVERFRQSLLKGLQP